MNAISTVRLLYIFNSIDLKVKFITYFFKEINELTFDQITNTKISTTIQFLRKNK
jgi:hypothetical protein